MDSAVEYLLQKLPLEAIPAEEFSRVKVGMMSFDISCYDIRDVGSLSVMTGSAMFGVMKMVSAIITPSHIDAPLFSYDRINVMSSDTILFEAYDTCLAAKVNTDGLDRVAASYADISDYPLEKRWYDDMRLPCSMAKKMKKRSGKADALALDYAKEYVNLLSVSPCVDPKAKSEKNNVYINGLLEKGGTSTDAFVKAIGSDRTRKLFTEFLFRG